MRAEPEVTAAIGPSPLHGGGCADAEATSEELEMMRSRMKQREKRLVGAALCGGDRGEPFGAGEMGICPLPGNPPVPATAPCNVPPPVPSTPRRPIRAWSIPTPGRSVRRAI